MHMMTKAASAEDLASVDWHRKTSKKSNWNKLATWSGCNNNDTAIQRAAQVLRCSNSLSDISLCGI